MLATEYDFHERLGMSAGYVASTDIRAVLLACIPGAVDAYPAAKANDRLGVDWWVEMQNARHLAVDAKVREEDWAAKHPEEDDLALEVWSVVECDVIGWTRDENKKCDFILWLWMDTKRYCLVPFPMLCHVFRTHWQTWYVKHKHAKQFTPTNAGGYHSECVFVPRKELWREIYRTYGGNRVVSKEAV